VRDVIGVAVLSGGRLLAARRADPPALAGLWELPGGKMEPGEDAAATAVREIEEELGCVVEVVDELEGTSPINEHLQLRVVTARLVEGDPVPHEHDAVRWLLADELDEVTWAEADVPFLDCLRRTLGSPS
jgi:8-oxo-dGTP diphosphatase